MPGPASRAAGQLSLLPIQRHNNYDGDVLSSIWRSQHLWTTEAPQQCDVLKMEHKRIKWNKICINKVSLV